MTNPADSKGHLRLQRKKNCLIYAALGNPGYAATALRQYLGVPVTVAKDITVRTV